MLIHTISNTKHEECIDITRKLQSYIDEIKLYTGTLTLHTPEDSTALTILNRTDPKVSKDYLNKLNQLVPKYNGMQFMGKNTQAIKASIAGKSLSLIVYQGQLALGKDQGVYFIEFAGPAENRHVFINAVGEENETVAKASTISDFHKQQEEKDRKEKEEEKRLIEDMRREYLKKKEKI